MENKQNDWPGVIGVLAFNLILAFNDSGIKLVKQLRIKVAFMVLRQQIKNVAGKQQVLVKFYWT